MNIIVPTTFTEVPHQLVNIFMLILFGLVILLIIILIIDIIKFKIEWEALKREIRNELKKK